MDALSYVGLCLTNKLCCSFNAMGKRDGGLEMGKAPFCHFFLKFQIQPTFFTSFLSCQFLSKPKVLPHQDKDHIKEVIGHYPPGSFSPVPLPRSPIHFLGGLVHKDLYI